MYPDTIAPKNPRAGECSQPKNPKWLQLKNGANPIEFSKTPPFVAKSFTHEVSGAVLSTNANIAAGAIAFLPAIEFAMNIPRIGIYNVNPPPANVFKALANGPLGWKPVAPA